MKKWITAIISFILLITCFSCIAEENKSCICSCNCSSSQETTTEDDSTKYIGLTDEEKYVIWFNMACPGTRNYYNSSTWIDDIKRDASFLLEPSPLCFTREETGGLSMEKYGNGKYVKNIYHFIHDLPDHYSALILTKNLLFETVPEEYEYVDSLITDIYESFLQLRLLTIEYIEKNGTLEGFNKKNVSLPIAYNELDSAISWFEGLYEILN